MLHIMELLAKALISFKNSRLGLYNDRPFQKDSKMKDINDSSFEV